MPEGYERFVLETSDLDLGERISDMLSKEYRKGGLMDFIAGPVQGARKRYIIIFTCAKKSSSHPLQVIRRNFGRHIEEHGVVTFFEELER